MGTNTTNVWINNDYVMELPYHFDVLKLKEVVYQALGSSRNHQYEVNNFPYMQRIQKLLPLLGWRWNIYTFPPYRGLDVHVDARRRACINIPISGGEGSVTSFYQAKPKMTTVYDPQKILYNVQDDLEKIFEFTLSKPSLINNEAPHSAFAGSQERVIISWGLRDNIGFKEAKQIIADLADVVIAAD